MDSLSSGDDDGRFVNVYANAFRGARAQLRHVPAPGGYISDRQSSVSPQPLDLLYSYRPRSGSDSTSPQTDEQTTTLSLRGEKDVSTSFLDVGSRRISGRVQEPKPERNTSSSPHSHQLTHESGQNVHPDADDPEYVFVRRSDGAFDHVRLDEVNQDTTRFTAAREMTATASEAAPKKPNMKLRLVTPGLDHILKDVHGIKPYNTTEDLTTAPREQYKLSNQIEEIKQRIEEFAGKNSVNTARPFSRDSNISSSTPSGMRTAIYVTPNVDAVSKEATSPFGETLDRKGSEEILMSEDQQHVAINSPTDMALVCDQSGLSNEKPRPLNLAESQRKHYQVVRDPEYISIPMGPNSPYSLYSIGETDHEGYDEVTQRVESRPRNSAQDSLLHETKPTSSSKELFELEWRHADWTKGTNLYNSSQGNLKRNPPFYHFSADPSPLTRQTQTFNTQRSFQFQTYARPALLKAQLEVGSQQWPVLLPELNAPLPDQDSENMPANAVVSPGESPDPDSNPSSGYPNYSSSSIKSSRSRHSITPATPVKPTFEHTSVSVGTITTPKEVQFSPEGNTVHEISPSPQQNPPTTNDDADSMKSNHSPSPTLFTPSTLPDSQIKETSAFQSGHHWTPKPKPRTKPSHVFESKSNIPQLPEPENFPRAVAISILASIIRAHTSDIFQVLQKDVETMVTQQKNLLAENAQLRRLAPLQSLLPSKPLNIEALLYRACMADYMLADLVAKMKLSDDIHSPLIPDDRRYSYRGAESSTSGEKREAQEFRDQRLHNVLPSGKNSKSGLQPSLLFVEASSNEREMFSLYARLVQELRVSAMQAEEMAVSTADKMIAGFYAGLACLFFGEVVMAEQKIRTLAVSNDRELDDSIAEKRLAQKILDMGFEKYCSLRRLEAEPTQQQQQQTATTSAVDSSWLDEGIRIRDFAQLSGIHISRDNDLHSDRTSVSSKGKQAAQK